MQDDPLTPDEVSAFLDGKLDGAELARVENHLAENPGARQEVIKASRILASAPKHEVRRWPRSYALIGLAAAAAIAVVIIRPTDNPTRAGVAVSTERRGLGDESDKIELLSPSNAEQITPGREHLVWESINGSTYRVVISDASGNKVFEATTRDTSLALPESIRASGTYYWKVDGQAADGTSVPSDVKEFVISGK